MTCSDDAGPVMYLAEGTMRLDALLLDIVGAELKDVRLFGVHPYDRMGMRHSSSFHCLPEGSLIDRPTALICLKSRIDLAQGSTHRVA